MMLACVGLSMTAMAIPAKRVNQVVRQSDGTELTVQLRGDETFHYYVTLDGTPVRQTENGDWVKDTRDLETLHRVAFEKRNKSRLALAPKMRKAMRAVKAPYLTGTVTTKKGLLILVNFSDKKMVNGDNSNSIFDQMLNGRNNPYGQNKGSIHEYFNDQSYGQFDIEFDVAGPVTLSKTMSYYGTDQDGDDAHAADMVKEACKLVDSQINFSDYDWDGDGEVENIYVTYAGYGQANGAPSNTIWPHQWDLASATGSSLRLDGVTINTYACGSELAGTSGRTIDGIGTMCHEYSHCLGLPDFYDTRATNNKNYGMSSWSLMDYGCYNDDGFCPAGYTAYERWFSGWLEPVVLNEGCVVANMKDIEENPEAYIIYNDQNRNEYYMLANHQNKGWDAQAPGHGMMVLHVDYDQSAWYNNTVNNTSSRQRMTIIPADNSLNMYSEDADLWPSTNKNTELTDTSTPAAKTYNANTDGQKLMHKPITNITEKNGLIGFTFMDGQGAKVAAPTQLEILNETSTGFTLKWAPAENAASYNLQLTETAPKGDSDAILDALNMLEDFENFYVEDEDATVDGMTDLSDQLDKLTYIPGWTGSKVYAGLGGAKFGSSKALGYMTTPDIEGTTGELTIYLEAWDWFNYATYLNSGAYNKDGTTMVISLLDANGQELQKQEVPAGDLFEAMDGNEEPIFLHFSNVPAVYQVKIATNSARKRAYVSYFISFDGNFTEEEIYSIWEESEEAPARLSARRHVLKPAARRAAARRASQTRTIENVTTTEYAFTELLPGYTYTVQAQTVDPDGNLSAWSESVSVTLAEDGSLVAAPTDLEIQNETSTGFTLTWNPAENAVSYNLQLTETEPGSGEEVSIFDALNMYEDFEYFFVEDENATADETVDLSSQLDNLTYFEGWTGSQIYKGLGGARFGSATASGYITTPVMEGTSGELTIYLEAWDWFDYEAIISSGDYVTDGTTMIVSLLDANGMELQKTEVPTGDLFDAMYGGFDPIIIHFSNVPEAYKVKVATNGAGKRAYVSYFISFDGNFTDEEVNSIWEDDSEDASTRIAARRHALKPAARRAVARRASQTNIIENVTTTEYAFTDLQPGYTYTVKVQAVDAEGNRSAWSESVSVVLTQEVAVNDLKVATSKASAAFDLTGRRVAVPAKGRVLVIDGKKVVLK